MTIPIELDQDPDAADLRQLAEHRPTPEDIDATWRPERRERVLAGILATARTKTCSTASTGGVRRRGARRLAAIIATAAAAALAATVVPGLVTPASLPAAGAIDRLAAAASRGEALVIPAGPYLHLVVHDTQQGGGISINGSRTLESWTSSDGHVWRKDTENGRVSYHSFPALTGGPIDMSPAGVTTLPTESGALFDYLEERVQGSKSVNEAIFVAVGDMTRMGYTPPAVRAAAIEALGRLPQVTAAEGDGRVTLTYVDEAYRPGVSQSMVFDATSTALVAETLSGPDLVYTSETLTSEVVEDMPSVVRAEATGEPQTKPTGSEAATP